MLGVYLPGDRTVDRREVRDPTPGFGQVVLAMRASMSCGSDLRAIYREHLGEGPEAYQNVIGGHEPSGEVVETGPGVTRLRVGDRVVVYHISGCGQCDECRRGYQISCLGPNDGESDPVGEPEGIGAHQTPQDAPEAGDLRPRSHAVRILAEQCCAQLDGCHPAAAGPVQQEEDHGVPPGKRRPPRLAVLMQPEHRRAGQVPGAGSIRTEGGDGTATSWT
jgi:hypothetical protein